MAEKRATPRVGRRLGAGLTALTVGLGVGIAAIPVSNWMDQREQLDDARERRAELEFDVAELQADIEGLIGEDGLEVAALCYGPFVEVGEEVYAIPGLEGCVTNASPE